MRKSHEKILVVGSTGVDVSAYVLAALAEKFPLVVTAEKKDAKAYIRITGAIYEWNNSAEEITRAIDGFLAEGITDVEVYLNGPGGDVFQAAEIENQIQRFPGSKTGTGGALIASAYTKIAASLDSFSQAENGQYMYHKPSGFISGNEDKVESSLQLLKNLTTQYKEAYSALTGLSVDEIESKWKTGDVWLTAKEAADQKFITGVIKKAAITPDTKAMFEAFGAPKIPNVTSEKPKKQLNIMDKEKIALLLGLSKDASDAQIEAAIIANKEAAATVTALKKEKKDAEMAAHATKVDSLLSGGVKDKKITADQVENLKKWAMSDFEGCEAHIKSLPTLGKVSDAITPGAKTETKKFADMSAEEKDTLASEDPEAFKAAYLADLEGK